MKIEIRLGIMIILTFLVLTACEKKEEFSIKSVEGRYVGTLTLENEFKTSIDITNGENDAIVDVSDSGNGQVEIHCYGGEIDTTFMLNYYEHNDSAMVCLSGDAFEEMYGHMMGHEETSSGMMGGMNSGQSDWMNHMDTEHEQGDEHFGGFDMTNNTFDYTFSGEDGNYHFKGTKM